MAIHRSINQEDWAALWGRVRALEDGLAATNKIVERLGDLLTREIEAGSEVVGLVAAISSNLDTLWAEVDAISPKDG